MESAWTVKIPTDRKGTFITFEIKELGIDAFMAVQDFINKKKWKEAFLMFFRETRVGGDEIGALEDEFAKNNIIPFNSLMQLITEIMEPVPGELKKN